MLRVALLSLSALVLLTACTASDDRIRFDGAHFRTKAKKVDDDRAVFAVSVSRASQTLAGAVEAGKYEATRYCIKNFGSSRVEWAHGPDVDPQSFLTSKDTLVMQGECKI